MAPGFWFGGASIRLCAVVIDTPDIVRSFLVFQVHLVNRFILRLSSKITTKHKRIQG